MAVLGLRFCARAFSSCGKRGPLFIAVRGPLTIAASLIAEHRLQTRRLSSCGSRAQLLRGMWDPPRPGLEPVSPALAGRFSTTAPPGKPLHIFIIWIWALYKPEILNKVNEHGLSKGMWHFHSEMNNLIVSNKCVIRFPSKYLCDNKNTAKGFVFCLTYKKYSPALRCILSRYNSQVTYCLYSYFM